MSNLVKTLTVIGLFLAGFGAGEFCLPSSEPAWVILTSVGVFSAGALILTVAAILNGKGK